MIIETTNTATAATITGSSKDMNGVIRGLVDVVWGRGHSNSPLAPGVILEGTRTTRGVRLHEFSYFVPRSPRDRMPHAGIVTFICLRSRFDPHLGHSIRGSMAFSASQADGSAVGSGTT